MCDLCDENDGRMESCQDCGRLICFDVPANSVDVIDRAYVTASGDLFCTRCGRNYDATEEAEENDAAEFWDEFDEAPEADT